MKNIILLFLILTNPILLTISKNEMTKQFLHNYEIIKNHENKTPHLKIHRKLHKPSEVVKNILGSEPVISLSLIVAGMFIADHFLTDNRRERKLTKIIVRNNKNEKNNKIFMSKKNYGNKFRKLDKDFELENDDNFLSKRNKRKMYKNFIKKNTMRKIHKKDKNQNKRKIYKNFMKKKNNKKNLRKLDQKILTENQAEILEESKRYLKGESNYQKQIDFEKKRFTAFVNRRGEWKKNLTPEKSLRIFKSYLQIYEKKDSKKLFGEVKDLMRNMIGE